MPDIPTSIFHKILILIPADSLARSRSVSKSWRKLIDDTVFLRSHLQRQMDGDNIIFRTGNRFIGNLFSFPFSSLDYDPKTREKTVYATKLKNLIRKNVPVITHFSVASCLGLILLFDYDVKKTWAIWNPFTGDFLEIPHCSNQLTKGVTQTYVGFGYDEISDDYKVVKVSRRLSESVLETCIYSVKLASWKKIEDYPDYVGTYVSEDGAFYNDALYWFKYVKEGGGSEVLMIIVLDLATEKYREIPVPISVSDNGKYPVEKELDGLGGCLLFSCYYEGLFDVWVLEDGGESVMWRKLLSLKEQNVIPPRVVSYIRSKEQVVVQNGNCFLWFDVKKKCEESDISGLMWKVTVKGSRGEISSQAFPISLIKLKGSSPSRVVKGKLKRKRRSTVNKESLELKLKTRDFRVPSDPENQVPSDEEDSSDFEEYDDSGRFLWYECA